MRQTIESAPKNQEAIILEDDASGAFDVAHWSPEAGEWISENGEPSRITPTHWLPLPQDQSLERSGTSSPVGHARRRFATFSIIALVLAGLYFHAEIAAWVTRSAGQQDTVGIGAIDVQKTPPLKQAAVPATETGQPLSKEAVDARNTIDQSIQQLRSPAADSAQSIERDREKTAALALGVPAARQEQAASTAQRRPALEEERARAAALATELAGAHLEIEADTARLTKAREDAAQFRLTSERTTAELQKERERAEALSRELVTARREIEANTALLTKAREDAVLFKRIMEGTATEQQKERESTEALSRELAAARREIETNTAQLAKAREDMAQVRQTAETTMAELQKERESAETLSRELAMSRREIEANTALLATARYDAAKFQLVAEKVTAEQQNERDTSAHELATARREIEANAALLTAARDDAEKFRQTAETTTAELQQERDRATALSRELTMAQGTMDARTALAPAPIGPITQAALAAETTASVQPAAAGAPGNPEAARLMARASALLAQGNIGAARIVLERAAETGSPQASFMLAETYDPVILSTWGTYGTRGEATKARELYAKAHAGGIQEAKNRFDALSQ